MVRRCSTSRVALCFHSGWLPRNVMSHEAVVPVALAPATSNPMMNCTSINILRECLVGSGLTPIITDRSSSASTSSCSVSFLRMPVRILASTARLTILYTWWVAHSFLIMLGVGSNGSKTVAGVVPLSRMSYRYFKRETRATSLAMSSLTIERAVVWNSS